MRFKLIQNNPRKWADVLLTIVPDGDRAEQQRVYAIAGEFLSALSWENSSRVEVENVGGMGVPHGYSLSQAKCRVFVLPKGSLGGSVENGLTRIPDIETDEQRKALILFREPRSSNTVWLSFLFFWQVMEVDGRNPVGWIKPSLNDTWEEKRKGGHRHANSKTFQIGIYQECAQRAP